MKKLQVQAFFDNTRGHEKQTRAILDSLNSLTPVKITESQVGPKSLLTIFRFFFEKLRCRLLDRAPGNNGPDLIIGTGSNCHLPMLIADQHHPGAKIVTCMTPEKFLINCFDLCLVPTHDRAKDAPNIFRTIGPPCPVRDQHRHKSNRGLILIGGIDHKSHYWDTSRVIDQLREIISRNEIHWTVSSSPRTPDTTLQALDELCAHHENVDFFRAENTPPGWIEEQYHENSLAWVTADSVSMVYEALSAGCRVGILPVKWKQEDNKFQRSLTYLAGEKLLSSFEEKMGPITAGEKIEFNEAMRCAGEILRRWWPEKLA